MGNELYKLYNEENLRHEVFVKAAALGDLKTVKAMLHGDFPVDVDGKYHSAIAGDMTALYMASDQGNLTMVKVLLRAGANVHKKCGFSEWTPLHAACYRCRSVEVVEELLKAGANVNVKAADSVHDIDIREITPLLCLEHYFKQHPDAVMDENRLQIARLLLEAKCDVNNPKWLPNAIRRALRYDLDELLPLLLEYGAVIPKDVMYWCQPHTRVEKFATLFEHGWDVNAHCYHRRTALHYAAAYQRLDIVQLLLDHNADVSIVDRKRKRTPLMAAIVKEQNISRLGTAADEDQLAIVRLLLQQMALTNINLIDHQDHAGFTALHLAARGGSAPIVQEILNWKPNLFLQCRSRKETALHCTLSIHDSQSNQLEKLKCLFEHTNGYNSVEYNNLQNKNTDRYTVQTRAVKSSVYHNFLEQLSCIVRSKRRGDSNGNPPLPMAAKNLPNQDGHTVLQKAVACRDYHPFIEYLSSVIDVRIPDGNGDTALHMAAKNGLSGHFLNLLLLRGHHGVEAANVLNHQGRTALMEAIVERNSSAVMALCHVTEIDINITDDEDKTALHYAVRSNESLYVDMLLERDANILARDAKGNTPLALACRLHCYNDDELPTQLSMIFQLYRYGAAYGEQSNMI